MSNNLPVPTGQPSGVISPYASVDNFEVAQHMAKHAGGLEDYPRQLPKQPRQLLGRAGDGQPYAGQSVGRHAELRRD